MVRYKLRRRASIKDVVEALGVPHTEVYGIKADGCDSDFSLVLDPETPPRQVSVLPACGPVDVTRASALRPRAFARVRFLADENVARLGRLLRTLGLDAATALEHAGQGRGTAGPDSCWLPRGESDFSGLPASGREVPDDDREQGPVSSTAEKRGRQAGGELRGEEREREAEERCTGAREGAFRHAKAHLREPQEAAAAGTTCKDIGERSLGARSLEERRLKEVRLEERHLGERHLAGVSRASRIPRASRAGASEPRAQLGTDGETSQNPAGRGRGSDKVRVAEAVDCAIAQRAAAEGRILLSADRGVLKRSVVEHGMLVTDHDPCEQLRAVLQRFAVPRPFRPFSRCLRCNVPLQPVDKKDVLHLLQPKTIRYFNVFSYCPRCGGVFWKGSHHGHVLERLADMGLLDAPK